jgi:hypothetical protein
VTLNNIERSLFYQPWNEKAGWINSKKTSISTKLIPRKSLEKQNSGNDSNFLLRFLIRSQLNIETI